MNKFAFHINTILPDDTLKDVKKLRRIIMQDLNIMISMQDTYLLWSVIGEDFYEDKLAIPGITIQDYLKEKMREHGTIIYGG